MSAIAATSAYASNALLSLLNDAAATAPAPIAKKAATPSPSNNPIDRVDLSEHAKAVLARANSEQGAADKLVALVQSLRGPSGKSTPPKSNAGPQLFDQLTGGAQRANSKSEASPLRPSGAAQPAISESDAQALDTLGEATQPGRGYTIADGGGKVIDGISEALLHANTHTDHVDNFHVVVKDLLTPSTPEEIDQFYKSEDVFTQEIAQAAPWVVAQDSDGFYQAVRDRAVTFLKATDIPDLNFHNTVTFDFNGFGVSAGTNGPGSYSYNRDASIFKDPTTNYAVGSNGNVLAWKKPATT